MFGFSAFGGAALGATGSGGSSPTEGWGYGAWGSGTWGFSGQQTYEAAITESSTGSDTVAALFQPNVAVAVSDTLAVKETPALTWSDPDADSVMAAPYCGVALILSAPELVSDIAVPKVADALTVSDAVDVSDIAAPI